MRNRIELIKRYVFLFFGILTNALGVAFITRSSLGVGPTTCIPYVISVIPAVRNFKFFIPLSYGAVNFLFCFLLYSMLFLMPILTSCGRSEKKDV